MKPLHAIVAALAATSIIAVAANGLAPLPEGWVISGQSPQLYRAGIDRGTTITGNGAKTIRSVDDKGESWATLMQMATAEPYRGKRLRFQARVKTNEISKWAGLWMRIDGRDGKSLGFYNSQDKPIKGTTEWTLRSVVLDVPSYANAVGFGVIANGSGQVWIDDLSLDTVANSVPVDSFAPVKLKAPVL
jgi:hypothetical protein